MMAAFLSVLASLLVGLFLAIAPWTPFWEANHLLQLYPALRQLLLNGFARGAITGLGLVNVLLAFIEAHQHVRDGGDHV
jgi:hypothetical protein